MYKSTFHGIGRYFHAFLFLFQEVFIEHIFFVTFVMLRDFLWGAVLGEVALLDLQEFGGKLFQRDGVVSILLVIL